MLKNSHRAFAIALTPIFTYKIELLFDIFFINQLVLNYNKYIEYIVTNYYLLVPVLITYIFASTFPDIDQRLKVFFNAENKDKRFLYHRQYTHSLLLWIGLLIFTLFYKFEYIQINILLFVFVLGVLTHLLGDMLTGSIPWALYAPYYARFTRIGITIFLPKTIHKIFTEIFPKWLNKYYLIVFSLLFFLLVLFRYKIS